MKGKKLTQKPKCNVGVPEALRTVHREQKRDQTSPFRVDGWGMNSLHGRLHCEHDTSEF